LEIKEKEGVYMSLAKKIKEEGIKEGIQKGREEGIQKGREEGLKQKARETAKRMISDGIELNVIAKYTGLTEEEIKNL
jgi:predicted transposase/invertase (TIGR01784 family)